MIFSKFVATHPYTELRGTMSSLLHWRVACEKSLTREDDWATIKTNNKFSRYY